MSVITDGLIGAMLQIDKAIYSAIGAVYDLLIRIAETEIFSNESISNFSTRVYALLGIFMIFKLTFSLITYIVNPDDFLDKSKGMTAIGKRIVISLSLVVLTPYIFAEAKTLQSNILHEQVLENIVFGSQNVSYDSFSQGGELIQFNLFSQFVKPNTSISGLEFCNKLYADTDGDGEYDHPLNDEGEVDYYSFSVNEECFQQLESLFGSENSVAFRNYKSAYEKQNFAYLTQEDIYTVKGTDSVTNTEKKLIDYQITLSTVVGAVTLLILVIFCIDVATRSIKLGFYQIIAPIPIISYCDPKSGKDGMFKKWAKACVTTYLDLFIRLLALYLAIYIIILITQDYKWDGWATIFVILGALIFAKQLPKIIQDITGFKLDGKFTLNPFKKVEEEALGAKAVFGAAGGSFAGFAGGRGFGRILSTFSGAARGAITNKGFGAGVRAQADVNRKVREARINGAGFWKARFAGAAYAVGLDDAGLEKEATEYERNKAIFDKKSREIEAEKNGYTVRKKQIQNGMASKNRQKSAHERLQQNIKSMEDRAIDQIKTNAAGEISNIYGRKRLHAEFMKNNIGKHIDDNGQLLNFGESVIENINNGTNGYSKQGNEVFYQGKKIATIVTNEMAQDAQKDADHYLNEVGKYDYMTQVIAKSKGAATYKTVDGNDVATDTEDLTLMNKYNSYLEALKNLGDDENNVEASENFDRNVVAETGKGLHKQFGTSKGVVGNLDRSMYSDNDQIKEIDDSIVKLESETDVKISGWAYDENGNRVYKDNLTYEEAAKYLDSVKKEIDHKKAVSKAYRDRALAEQIRNSGK